ncbi:pyridoxine 5'-phosphate synthase, partial [Acinetobacter baumannii]|nr:pyridoxine 5'-phosphate synthase [Acinetobacter baumannii]
LNVSGDQVRIGAAVERLSKVGTRVSLFIDPEKGQIDAAVAIGAPVIEFHTGTYANAVKSEERRECYLKL